ncbi:unnamed protein product, partial [Ectocarpus sp. 12 AP-2014]
MEMVQLLLLKGADKDVIDNLGYTPLYLAVLHGRVAAVLALLHAGADISLRCGISKRSVLHVAAEEEHVDIMRAVVERGANVEALDDDHNTPLHLAAFFNRVEAIDLLLEAGANIEARDESDSTPLHCAVLECHLETMSALLKHG